MNIPEGINDLFQEKSLFAVYRKSVFLSESAVDVFLKITSFLLLTATCLFINVCERDRLYILYDALSKWVDVGFNYSVQILGFLLAGFTIFATTTDIKVFIGLSKVTNKGRALNELKFLFFSFLRVFIVHLTVLISCVIVTMFRSISKSLLQIIISDEKEIYNIRSTIVSMLCIVVGCFIISALLQLKTFVWNLYQSVIFSIASSATLSSSSDGPPQS